MVNEWVYCPRLFFMMFVQGLFEQSAETIEGTAEHARGSARPRDRDLEAPPWPASDVRELTLASDEIGATARVDALAEDAASGLVPVESKHGRAPEGESDFHLLGAELSGDAWPNDQVQVALQGLLLREAGYACSQVRIHYRGSKKTVRISLGTELERATLASVAEASRAVTGPIPPPLVDSPKCTGCSLNAVCLPDETNLLLQRQSSVERKVVPARSDGAGAYVVTQGARVGKKGQTLEVRDPSESTVRVPLKDCSHLAVFGRVQVSTPALTAMLEARRSVTWHRQGGRCIGRSEPLGSPNLAVRKLQFSRFEDPATCQSLARNLISAKIGNQRTLLRRNREDGPRASSVLNELRQLRRRTHGESMQGLLGLEGRAARVYFAGLSELLGEDEDGLLMDGRSRRPPKDPVNASMSFGYALLLSDALAALARVGLEPDLGFYHQSVPGRPALALDLMEPFRPIVVDSLVLRCFRTRQLSRRSFAEVAGSFRMKDGPRRRFIQSYEDRMNDLVTHPRFDYRMSYRRILEVESRLLSRFLLGELAEWKPLETR